METNQYIAGIIAATQKLKEANEHLEASLNKLQQTQEKVALNAGKLSKAYKDNAEEIKKAESAIKRNTEQIEKNVKMLDAVKGSIDKNTAAFDKLQSNITQNTKSQKDNTATVNKLTDSYKALGKAIADGGESVKDSSKDFEYGKKAIEAIDSSMDELKESAGKFAPTLEEVSKGFNALKTGSELVKEGFKGVGSALKATGFGLFLIAIESLTEYFTKDKIGIKRFQALLAGIGVVVDKIKSGFNFLGKTIVDAILSPADTAKKLWNGFVENIGNRFKAFGVILDGVMHLNPKKITDGVLQLTTGVTNATDKIVSSFKMLREEGSKTAAEIIKAGTDALYAPEEGANASRKSSRTRKRKSSGTATHQISRLPELMLPKAKSFLDSVQEDQKHYDTEMAMLTEQLDKKLITQDEYYEQSKVLQDKYHNAIAHKTNIFINTDLDAAKKHAEDLARQRDLEAAIAYDEKNVKKAILPWVKFAAEKQLINDKYKYEISLANGNAEKIKEIEEKTQKDLKALHEQYEKEKKELAVKAAQFIADKAFSIVGNNIKTQSDAKIKALEKDKANELSNKNLTATQRKAIEDKYQKKENQEKIRAFKANQKAQIAQALINGAIAVQKTIAEWGMPFAIPSLIPVAASTVSQVATIASQKPPAFAKGGRYVSDGRGALLPGYSRADDTNAYLRSGEAVVVSEAMLNPWARNLVSAINVAHGGRDFSMPNSGRGYAIGGIFTDGGNANRYYNQPVNDIKEMANTLAYQMINNFPPIYVDVKDVNTQQNILAQTVNRVNL